jgi:hypothetical protein
MLTQPENRIQGLRNPEVVPLTLTGKTHRTGVPMGHPYDVMNLYFFEENTLHWVIGSLSKSIPVKAAS